MKEENDWQARVRVNEWRREALADADSPAARFVASVRAHGAFLERYGNDALNDRGTAFCAALVARERAARAARAGECLTLRNEVFQRSEPRSGLACQSDNISGHGPEHVTDTEREARAFTLRKTSDNTAYRRKKAFEVEENINAAIETHGRKMARALGQEFSGLPAVNRARYCSLGLEYCLEFTVTIPAQGKDLTARYFSEAWEKFNEAWFARQVWVDSWVMVKEPQKSGELHAHLLVLTRESVFRPGRELRFYERKSGRGKATVIDGRTCARWISQTWEELRSEVGKIGVLEENGMGSSHTLQPIKSREKFAKYISKYLTKGFKADRPKHLKSVRLVAYSKSQKASARKGFPERSPFPRCCRVFERRPHFDNGELEHEKIHYKTRVKPEIVAPCDGFAGMFPEFRRAICSPLIAATGHRSIWADAERWDMQQTFSFNGPLAYYRRRRLSEVGQQFGCSEYEDLQRKFGKRWAHYIEPLLALDDPGDWGSLSDSAIDYRLSQISKLTALDPIYRREGEEITRRALDAMPEDRQMEFEFAWHFRGKTTGILVEFEHHETAILPEVANFRSAAFSQMRKVARDGDDNSSRVFRRDRYPAGNISEATMARWNLALAG